MWSKSVGRDSSKSGDNKMMEPIPFVGYLEIDETQMLQQKIEELENEVSRLNKEIMRLKILSSKIFVYDPDDNESIWIIERHEKK